ncbi:hypothetical protein BaRGS_00026097, partial [Batillaria attramentaria]
MATGFGGGEDFGGFQVLMFTQALAFLGYIPLLLTSNPLTSHPGPPGTCHAPNRSRGPTLVPRLKDQRQFALHTGYNDRPRTRGDAGQSQGWRATKPEDQEVGEDLFQRLTGNMMTPAGS